MIWVLAIIALALLVTAIYLGYQLQRIQAREKAGLEDALRLRKEFEAAETQARSKLAAQKVRYEAEIRRVITDPAAAAKALADRTKEPW